MTTNTTIQVTKNFIRTEKKTINGKNTKFETLSINKNIFSNDITISSGAYTSNSEWIFNHISFKPEEIKEIAENLIEFANELIEKDKE